MKEQTKKISKFTKYLNKTMNKLYLIDMKSIVTYSDRILMLLNGTWETYQSDHIYDRHKLQEISKH